MATLDTPLNVAPYFDDLDQSKGYERVLFKPTTSVQVRELNQLQSILSNQIERFGDSVYRNGTVISGCNFIFNGAYPYVKISDNDAFGNPSNPALYVGNFITNGSGLKAFVVDQRYGYEATAPDLKTMYITYINSGTSGNATSFSPGDLLTVTDSVNGVSKVVVNNGGLGFTNANPIVVVPEVIVQTTTGSFSNGSYVSQPSIGSNLQIIGIDANTYALQGQVVLTLSPRAQDLANSSASANVWSVANNTPMIGLGNTVVGQVVSVLGAGAAGQVITDSVGTVQSINVTSFGVGYTFPPSISVRSPNNLSGINALSLTAQNFIAQVSVANTASPVGNGYAFSVTDGVIYQKGVFLEVEAQTVLVSKYDQTPDKIVVGFVSEETIVTASIDVTLNDNATGSDNYGAPGADRIQITPTLVAATSAATVSNNFLVLVQWSSGLPFKQNQTSIYSNIGDEMARRTSDEAGDFVTDLFEVTTESPANNSLEGTTVNVVIDPGTAYVSGYRVSTDTNAVISIPKGIDTITTNTQVVSMVYGNYIDITSVVGSFQFSTGDVVSLQDTAANALSVHPNVATQVGNTIGTACIRSFEWVSGTPGTSNCRYRLYLFAINMSKGKTFGSIRSIYYGGTAHGCGDVVLSISPSTGNSLAVLQGTANNTGLLYPLGVASLKNANNITYTYRALFQGIQIANNGVLTYSLTSSPHENFPWIGPLSSAQAETIYLVPFAGLNEANAHAGTVATANGTSTLTGTSTTFVTDFVQGDYIYVSGNTTENCVRQIVSVTNSQYLTLDSNIAFTNTAAIIRRHFPNNVPIPIGSRTGTSVAVDVTQDVLTINIGLSFQNGPANCALAVDVQRTNVLPTPKTAARDRFVTLCLANNVANTTGPWCLGIPDVFRLKAVYVGSNSSVNTSGLNVTNDFFVNIGQNIDYLDLSSLSIDPKSSLDLTPDTWLLVQFDHFVASGSGMFVTPSYVSGNGQQVAVTDSLPLANLGSSINTMEIPQVYTNQGLVLDLLNCADFRPSAVNTVPSTTQLTLAPVNPAYQLSFGNTSNISSLVKFPNPTSVMTLTTEQYIGRVDSVLLAKDGSLFTMHGATGTTLTIDMKPNQPDDTMCLNVLAIPPYPTLPQYPSNTVIQILNNRRLNGVNESQREAAWTVSELFTALQTETSQPVAYTMEDIGNIDRRLQTVEYYQALSVLEADLSTSPITSNNDPTTNRFKFGIFADDYSTYNYSANNDPEWSAAVANNKLVPASFEWSAAHSAGGNLTLPYIDYVIVSQGYATGNPPPVVQPPVTTSYTQYFPVTYSNYQGYFPGANGIDNAFIDYYFAFNFMDNVTDCTLYFWTGVPGSQIDLYQTTPSTEQVFDGFVAPGTPLLPGTTDAQFLATTPIVTGANVVPLTQADIEMLLNPLNTQFAYFGGTSYLQKNFVPEYPGQLPEYGKISWTHDPSKGSHYLFDIKNLIIPYDNVYGITNEFIGVVSFKSTTTTTASTIPATTSPSANNGAPQYNGTLTFNFQTPWNGPSMYGTTNTSLPYVVDGRYIIGSATGLKPNTVHNFYINGVNEAANIGVPGFGQGVPLKTDASGKFSELNLFLYSALADELNNKSTLVLTLADSSNTSVAIMTYN